jgi:hypothetical protein
MNTKIHISGFSALLVCGACIYLFTVRPILQAKQRIEFSNRQTSELSASMSSKAIENARLKEEIEKRSREIQSRFQLITTTKRPAMEIVTNLLEQHRAELINLRQEASLAENADTFSLHLGGHYTDVIQLVDAFRRLDRPVRISALNLAARDDRGLSCTAKLVLTLWRPTARGESMASKSVRRDEV